MSDNEFFSGTWLKANQTAATSSGGAAVVVGGGGGGSAGPTEASQELLRKEGVDRIVSMEELSKMLSRNAKAGTTPNCPFDCDCCF
jgi:phage-related minor tail protein